MKKTKSIPTISGQQKAESEEEIIEQAKRIEFYITEYSVELLANKMEKGEFQVPLYQRAFTWEPERKSRFIESLIMGLPIPFLFFWEMEDGRLEIVDGSQRLRTIQEFILSDFRLTELEALPSLTNCSFADLLESRQRKIRNRSIRGIVLNEHADEQARFDMFERINTSSKVANKAEVRRGALGGPFMDLVIELAQLSNFVSITPMADKLVLEREREELVTRYFAYGDGLEGYKDRPAEFLFNYVKKMNDHLAHEQQLANKYRQRFLDMLQFVSRVFPNGFGRTKKATATPRSRFEAIAIGSYMALQADPGLSNRSPNMNWLDETEFKKITGADGANAKARLRGRIDFVQNKLLAG
jgi:hypothetical protein